MAKLGKEATTTRRVLESLFRYFDNANLWSLENGLAFPVLKDMQFLMDNSGTSNSFTCSIGIAKALFYSFSLNFMKHAIFVLFQF